MLSAQKFFGRVGKLVSARLFSTYSLAKRSGWLPEGENDAKSRDGSSRLEYRANKLITCIREGKYDEAKQLVTIDRINVNGHDFGETRH